MIIGHSAGPADETTLVTGVDESDINIYKVLAEVPQKSKSSRRDEMSSTSADGTTFLALCPIALQCAHGWLKKGGRGHG